MLKHEKSKHSMFGNIILYEIYLAIQQKNYFYLAYLRIH